MNTLMPPDTDLLDAFLSLAGTGECRPSNGTPLRFAVSRPRPLPADADRILSLDGTWQAVRFEQTTDEATLCARALPAADWSTVQQPGRVFCADPERQPADIPNWDRRMLAHISPESGAVLRRTVRVPDAWDGKRLILRFDAVYPAARFYCNGALLGEHLSGLTPCEFDVTAHVQPGEDAVIGVRLIRRYEGQEIDMPRHSMEFAGIAQPACLFALEPCHVMELNLHGSYDASTHAGQVAGSVRVRNLRPRPATINLTGTLDAPDGRTAARFTAQAELAAAGECELPVRLAPTTVQPWSDEQPHLYRLRLSLEGAGQAPTLYEQRVGFRDLRLTGGRPTLNGHPLKFRGVNHLTFHPEHGLFTPPDWLRRSLELMKRANVNGIRTHYAAPPALLDLCDEMGFLLVQELPIDWFGHWLGRRDCLPFVLPRIDTLVRRDRHHVALVAWSVGNENLPANEREIDPFNRNYATFEALIKRLAPDSFTMYPPPGPANKIPGCLEPRIGDIADVHYNFYSVRELNATGRIRLPRSWQGPWEEFSREELIHRGWSGTWFSSEYGIVNMLTDVHDAPYLSVIKEVPENPLTGKLTLQAFFERMEEEWGLMRDDPTCLGGAYFPWMCAGSGRADGWTLWGEDADWGVVTSDLLPKPYYWALRTLYSPIRFPNRLPWRRGQESLRFEIRNGFTSTDLADCTLRIQMGGGGPFMGILRDWRDIHVQGAPGSMCTAVVPLWHTDARTALMDGKPIICRCHLLRKQDGFRVITADIRVVPEQLADRADGPVTLGQDAPPPAATP